MKLRRRKNIVKRFAGDEEGAVMILTVILMMLLVKVMFSTYNVGVMTAERMRLQMVSDTAAYSSAVWQARFLNHCAYTRRAIIANYANAALFTAMEANKKSWDYYDDEKPTVIPFGCFSTTIDEDHWPYPTPTPRGSMKILGPMYDFTASIFSDDDSARNTAEALSRNHAAGQEVMYAYVSRPWLTIVPDIVKTSNLPVGGRNLVPIKIDEKYKQWCATSYSNNRKGLLNKSFVRQIDLSDVKKDIENRYDLFTVGSYAFLGGSLPFFVSRPFWAFDLLLSHLWTYPSGCSIANYPCINPSDVSMTTYYWTEAEDFDTSISSGSGNFSTKDEINMYNIGSYFLGWQWAWTPWTGFFCVPVYVLIMDSETWSSSYDFDQKPSDIKMYDLEENLDPAQFEPSVYVALKIERADLIGDGSGMFGGKLFHNKGMPLGNQVKDMHAISRAKVYFQPRWTENYYKPNLYYPYWEAQLAPVFGPGYDSANNILRTNGLNLMQQVLPAGVGTAQNARKIHY